MKNLLSLLLLTTISIRLLSQNPVTIEAESGTLGADFSSLNANGINYITCVTDLVASGNPGNANRVATYTVTFPAAGTYELYARIRVGPAGANDDSYFYANGFGVKTVSAGTNSDGDWILANNLSNVGDTAANTIVSGSGSIATNGIWKWVDMSMFNGGEAPISFTVTAGNLTQTFQIGGRENGLDIDKFVFGLTGYYFTVANLNNGQPGSTVPPKAPYTPTGPAIATGKAKFLGSAYSNPSQKPNFTAYWNQVTPENAGKWGSAEPTRGMFNWAELDSAYKTAKDNGFPFKMHTLIWGSQQPTWLDNLSGDDQLAAIKNWFLQVAQRYPAIDFIEVVNEPLHQPPNRPNGGGNYINALGGTGATGWDWVLNSFRLARQYFPATTKLWINDYSIVNSTASTATYLQIINLLKAENLIDGIGEQAHAFTTAGTSAATITANLNTLAGSGLPLYATELDIDGPPAETPQGDTIQLNEYKRVFPLFWQHPAVKGITVWGYRPGHWRTAQGAPLVYANGAEKAAMVWLKQYVQITSLPLPVRLTKFEATRKNNQVSISWSATGEVNNDRYEIERSGDGTNWLTLFTVRPHAPSQGNLAYTATDGLPLSGLNYYRLVQYDKDGNKTYYDIRTVNFLSDRNSTVQVYPNPASGSFVVRAEPDGLNKGTITIADAFGRTVKTLALPPSGMQTVAAQNMNGTYFVRINTNGKISVVKIVVGNK